MIQENDDKEPEHMAHLAWLDRLRPPPGWRTDRAVLSTYSAHLSVVAASLLALEGQDADDDASAPGTRVGLGRALSRLRGRVHVIVQAGRVTAGASKPSPIVALLDRFLIECPWDESAGSGGHSWHAKFALVRQVREDATHHQDESRWVFLMGSRNLTKDVSWDLGLHLCADATDQEMPAAHERKPVAGIAVLLERLVAQPFLKGAFTAWEAHQPELKSRRWSIPTGLDVKKLAMGPFGEPGAAFPRIPKDARRVIAVAPFVDAVTAAKIAKSGTDKCERILVSTTAQLANFSEKDWKKLEGLSCRVLPETRYGNEPDGEEEELIGLDQVGLHAKFLLASQGREHALWLGSPNLTQRAWGRNAECYAQVDLERRQSGKEVLVGIDAFLSMTSPYELPAGDAVLEDAELSSIEDCRTKVVQALGDACQLEEKDRTFLEASALVDMTWPEGLLVSWAPLSAKDMQPLVLTRRRFEWPGGQALHIRSNLLRFTLTLGDKSTSWVQCVKWNPPLGADRDVEAFRNYMGPTQSLTWLADVLQSKRVSEGGGPWADEQDEKTSDKRRARSRSSKTDIPTIEQMLRYWLSGNGSAEEIEHILAVWQRPRQVAPVGKDDNTNKEDVAHLQALSRAWEVIKKAPQVTVR